MLQVLGKPTSINVRKVLWTCTELDLAHTLQPYGAGFQPTDTPEFRALNPNALVPVVRDGDFVLWESNAICRYLAAAQGRDDLLPGAPRERARVEQWMDWQAGELNNAWRYAFMALVRKRPDPPDPEALAASLANWNRHMAMLDAQVERTGAFVVGAQFTLADVALGLSLNRWLATPFPPGARPELPALAAYQQRLLDRPGYRQHGANGIP
ncbi:MAG TPA: glutathione S-transferase [Burkholderiaceae bacterium]